MESRTDQKKDEKEEKDPNKGRNRMKQQKDRRFCALSFAHLIYLHVCLRRTFLTSAAAHVITQFFLPREPALSLSTFLLIFCEFKFTSSELVSNHTNSDTWTFLSFFAVNSFIPPSSVSLHREAPVQKQQPVQATLKSTNVTNNEGLEMWNRERPLGPAGDHLLFGADLTGRKCVNPVLTFQMVCGGCRENSLFKR